MAEKAIITWYTEQKELAESKFAHFEKRVNTFSFLRLFVLVAVVFGVYKSVEMESVLLTEATLLLGILAFAWLVSRQAGFEKQKSFYKSLSLVNQVEIDSILHQKNSYSNGEQFIDDEHVYTSDLDVFGKASLYNLVNRCATVSGNEKLSGWFKWRAQTPEIVLRQMAVKEFQAKKNWIQNFKARLLFAQGDIDNEVSKLFLYLNTPLHHFNNFLQRYIVIIPYLLLALTVLGTIYSPLYAVAIGLGLINLSIVFLNTAKINQADRYLGKAGKVLYNYSEAFKLIEEETFQSQLISQSCLKQSFGETAFHKKIKELSALASKLEYRLNIFVGPVLNFIFAWDVKQLLAIEHWKRHNTALVESAFDDLANIEALVSLAGIHINYPDWSFPQVLDQKGYTFIAKEIAHPLIHEGKRVSNNYQLEDTFKIDIITGSNMAGKSTFLRTLGINAVLAFAGAPVCASEMAVSNMLLFSYMRIKDSLNESTSTFKAELNRLKLLLTTLESNPRVFFMIDEMLRGTNSVDKYLGSKAIIEQLITQRSVGLVATHDVQLAKLEERYPDYIRNFYFDIQIVNREMLFDYKLKEGECKTFNAAILLEELGIRLPK